MKEREKTKFYHRKHYFAIISDNTTILSVTQNQHKSTLVPAAFVQL